MPRSVMYRAIFGGGLCLFLSLGCRAMSELDGSAVADRESPVARELGEDPEDKDSEEVELAAVMGEMQRMSAKLGFAIEGRNSPLADFYLEELGETFEKLTSISEHEGMPIGHPAATILQPALESLAEFLEQQAWEDTWGAYEVLIEACNRCHLATEHEFIEILPARGQAPFNQRFAAAEFGAVTEEHRD